MKTRIDTSLGLGIRNIPAKIRKNPSKRLAVIFEGTDT